MQVFSPKTTPKPSDFCWTYMSEDAQEIMRRARDIADKLGYWYTATHHHFYSFLEFNFATDNSLHFNIGFTILEFKNAMLRIDPPKKSERAFMLPLATTNSVWDCYLYSVHQAKTNTRRATPADLFDGLLHYREMPLDLILSERGIRIDPDSQMPFVVEDR